MKKDNLCVCGHLRSYHFIGTDKKWGTSEVDRCVGCPLNLLSAWHTFKQDNLRYLEMKYKNTEET